MQAICTHDSSGLKIALPLKLGIGACGVLFFASIAAGEVAAGPGAVYDTRSSQFNASPTSGSAPLTVKFCAIAGISIDFGDGTSGGMGVARSGDCPIGLLSYTSHTYTAPGLYRLHGSPCPSSVLHPACAEASQLAGTVSITVTKPH
jgi:hypothetical protein